MSIEVHPSNNNPHLSMELSSGNNDKAVGPPSVHPLEKGHVIHDSDHDQDEKKEQDLSITFAETEVSFASNSSSGNHHPTLVIRDNTGGDVETSRITLNTHNSILNIAEEDEVTIDDDELEEISIIHHHHHDHSFLLEEGEETDEGTDDEHTDLMIQHHHLSSSVSHDEDHAAQTCQETYTNPLSCIPRTPPQCRNSWCEQPGGGGGVVSEEHYVPNSSDSLAVKASNNNTEITGLFDYVDKLCFNKNNTTPHTEDQRDAAIVLWDQYQRILEYDILELLGCASPPDAEELAKVWQSTLVPNMATSTSADPNINGSETGENKATPAPPRARRRQWRERAVRVHRLRTERQQQHEHDPDALPPSIPMTSKVRSMDDRLWSNRHHQKRDSWPFQLFSTSSSSAYQQQQSENALDQALFASGPTSIPQHHEEEEEGYDSDPEERFPTGTTVLRPRKERTASPVDANILLRETTSIVDTVQESLNMSWSVTWHPPGGEAPRSVTVWIERGTLIEFNTVMLEPNLMWRENFHPELESKRKLNATSQKPHCVRLLNLCRILNGDEGGLLESSNYINESDGKNNVSLLVRPSHCVVIKTSDDQDFLFEANSIAERDEMVRRWKLTTARFATLAVLEDLETICKEFFSPMITSRMLVPDYDVQQDMA